MDPDDDPRADKRRRNNIAAAKYRQKKLDRIAELEAEVAAGARERDELRLRLAGSEREVELLRKLLAEKG